MMVVQFRTVLLFFLIFQYFAISQQLSPRISYTEWRALFDLRASLGITSKDWHKKLNPCSNWTGIECRNGYVSGINLSGLRRTREGKLNPRFAVDSLQSFALLSSFKSSGFSLPGQIPEWLGLKLSSLEVLDLSSSSIDGSIPSSIGSLSKLHTLNLSGNSFTAMIPAALGNLISLSVLDLSHNKLIGAIPDEIAALKNLGSLDLSLNILSGGIPIGFGSLSSLRLLNLSNNSISAHIPAQLGNLFLLKELDLGYNSLIGSLPAELGGLAGLRKLLIHSNALDGSLVGDLFNNLTQLEYFDVSYNKFTGVFPTFIASGNVSGRVFNFSNNLFYGNLTSVGGKFLTIDVSSNYFQGFSPNDTGSKTIVRNNCFSNLPDQRTASSCWTFYSERGFIFGNASVTEPMTPPLTRTKRKNDRTVFIMVGLFGGLGSFIVLVAGLLLLRKLCGISGHQKSAKIGSAPGSRKNPPSVSFDFTGIGESFSYEQMMQATNNFSNENLIKHGHSGDLFRGTLESGLLVVIKRVDQHSFGRELLLAELKLFSKLMHQRFVPLLGHCLEQEDVKILVYKYMLNGDLSNSLCKSEASEDVQSLDWITRLKIAIEAADALCYLHHECSSPLVHGDIQASCILLDNKYEVRLGSLSEVCAVTLNHPQNMISKMLLTKQNSGKRPSGSSSVSCTYDVYCFGKVLLELVTGRIGISKPNDADAKHWLDKNIHFISVMEKELVINIIDQNLIIDEDFLEEVWSVAIVAKSCLNPMASRRPTMRHVLKALENPFKVVRQESFSSGRLNRGLSTRSWTSAFFATWHHSSSESSGTSYRREIIGGMTQSERVGSHGSGTNDRSSSLKRSSSHVFHESVEIQDVEKLEKSRC